MTVEHPRYTNLLAQIQSLNPNTNPANPNYNMLTGFVLDKVVNDVANYTHVDIPDLPEGLDTTIISIVNTYMYTHGVLTPNGNGEDVSQIREGDTTVIFKSPSQISADMASVNPITDEYYSQLNVFRVVKK